MYLKSIELAGFKSFGKKTLLEFSSSITGIVGPNGSGKSNIAEAFRFVLGEQSMKSMRGKRGEDLIFNGGKSIPRAGRGGVKLVFDNARKIFSLDFDEVTIERVVHRDGINEYLLNGSAVRLKDIVELLAQANIGASGHHIISQGEADRILSAGNRERREMIEDALGLKAYLYKRHEAETKLEKTGDNIKEVQSLRREIAPHLKFLGSQVKKIEEAKALREELKERYLEYLKRETLFLEQEAALIAEERESPAKEKAMLDNRVKSVRDELQGGKGGGPTQELVNLEGAMRENSGAREILSRDLGRIEGEIRALERQHEEAKKREATSPSVPYEKVSAFAEDLSGRLEKTGSLATLEVAREHIKSLVLSVREFMRSLKGEGSNTDALEKEIHRLKEEKGEYDAKALVLKKEEQALLARAGALKDALDSARKEKQQGELELYTLMTRRGDIERILAELKNRDVLLERTRDDFKREREEAAVLIGRDVLAYESYELRTKEGEKIHHADILDEPRGTQEERRRKLEKMKIRLEESGGGSSEEILKEHRDVRERDEFLAREILDLEQSAQSLEKLIEELTETLEKRFTDGIEKINTEFDSFFQLMFGVGGASLKLTREQVRARFVGEEDEEQERDDKEETEQGIEISVTLPHKRIKGLHMLSGGERALTSIALIFAMSQVNPPPFLILDETDAALDEANSRRYGDMIENLSNKSQLILITHNRETMSRAGVLYGITMGSEGISRLLSVKFEEALAVAK
ncbi:MAG TPA: AAA family ATPase [Candidatus Paceibacterota bacterium]